MKKSMREYRLALRNLFIGALLLMQITAGSQAQTTTVAGSIPGEFAVSPTGAATYTIPIQVPPGVAGMAPKLALVYNSQSGNGMLGMGWSLSGLSAITRCPRTMAQDGVRGGVNFDINDRFCMDGQRLVLVKGTYGAAGSEYRTEIDSFSKIVANGQVGSGPFSFTVKTKSGLTIEYGNNSDSRIEAIKGAGNSATWTAGTIRTWAQNRIADMSGNYMTVTYESAYGTYYPSRIEYTWNVGPTLSPVVSVQFVRDTSRADAVTGYQAGATFKPTERISYIRIYLATSLVKEYRIAYGAQGSALDRSKITSITECDGSISCRTLIALTWPGNGTDAFVAGSGLANQFGPAQGCSDNNVFPRTLVDVNGDGLPDIVGFANNGVNVAINNSNGFNAPTSWLNNQYGTMQGWTDNSTFPRFVEDVNGDGLPDIVGFSNNGPTVALNTGSSFREAAFGFSGQFGTTQGWVNNNVNPRTLVDVNGDGLPDIVGFANSGVYVAINNGNRFNALTLWLYNQYGTTQGWTDNNTFPRVVVDVNGDGLPDIVGFSNNGPTVALNTGSSFREPNSWLSGQFGVSHGWVNNNVNPRTLVDVNGDGLPDIVGFANSGVYVAINNGNGFNTPTFWLNNQYGTSQSWTDNNTNPRFLVDVNGDGLPDIVGFSNNGPTVALNTGSSFRESYSWLSGQFGVSQGWVNNNVYPRTLADVNGDGLPDIVGFSHTTVTVTTNARNMGANYVGSISNGQGVVTSPSFASLTKRTTPATYTKDTGTNKATTPKIDLQVPMYVVSSVSKSNGLGGTTTTNYSYGGLKAEPGTGRGMLGFRWVKRSELETGIDLYTEYRQDWPYTGMATQSQTKVNSRLVKQTTNTFDCQALQSAAPCTNNPGISYSPFVKKSIESAWDLDGSVLPEITTAMSYAPDPVDGRFYGDPTRITINANDGSGKTTINEYFPADRDRWLLGRLRQASVLSYNTGDNSIADSQLSMTLSGYTPPNPAPPSSASQYSLPWYLIDVLLNDD